MGVLAGSLPSRERGLKLLVWLMLMYSSGSLPSRERGLKLESATAAAPALTSLPSRERGLKLLSIIGTLLLLDVAPFAGAWIETVEQCRSN